MLDCLKNQATFVSSFFLPNEVEHKDLYNQLFRLLIGNVSPAAISVKISNNLYVSWQKYLDRNYFSNLCYLAFML